MDAIVNNKTRLATFDIARIACIILVIIGHYDPTDAPAHYNNLLKAIYTFHMPVFLFISGFLYVVTMKDISFTKFIAKKIKRLAIPYLTTSAITITIKLLSQGSARIDHPVTLLSYLKMLYLPEAGYFLWFIWTLLTAFLVVFFFKSKQARLVLFVITFIISLLPSIGVDVFCIRQTQEMMVYFMTGVVIADYLPDIFKAGVIPTMIILLLFIGCEAFYIHQHSMIMYRSLAFIGIAATMTLCHSIDKHIPVLARSCVVLAPSVYIIYLFHTTILGFAKAAFGKIPFLCSNYDSTFYLQAICAIVLAVLIPILLHHLVIRRNKILRLLFGV